MKYLIIDAMLSGTGIRDKYESCYLNPEDLGLSSLVKEKLNRWLLKYEEENLKGFINDSFIDELDYEGKQIALIIKNELIEVKIEYFSDARMTKEII